MLLEMYHEIKNVGTLNPSTIMDLNRHIYQIFEAWPESKFKTLLKNAIPHMFTFLYIYGMPPHNNPAELEVRDVSIIQRNVRHKLMTTEGMRVFSVLSTFCRTCHKQNVFACRAIVEIANDSKWNIFEHDTIRDPDWNIFKDYEDRRSSAVQQQRIPVAAVAI